MSLVPSPIGVVQMIGAETGDLREFYFGQFYSLDHVGNPAIAADFVQAGAYSLKCGPGDTVTVDNFTGSAPFFRIMVRFNQFPDADTLIWQQSAAPIFVGIVSFRLWLLTTGHLAWEQTNGHAPGYLDISPLGLLPGGGPEKDGFYRVESYIGPEDQIVSNPWGMECRLDGVIQWHRFAAGLQPAQPAAQTNLVLGPAAGGGNVTMWFDSLVWALTGYPGPGGVIARSPIEGSTAFNEWTPVGTATRASAVTQTPPNPASYCQSDVQGAIQMLQVHAFSNIQPGHGSEIITEFNVLTGCRARVLAWHVNDTHGGTQLSLGIGTADGFIGQSTYLTEIPAIVDGQYGVQLVPSPASQVDQLSIQFTVGAMSGVGPEIVADAWIMAEGTLTFSALPPPAFGNVHTASPRTGDCREGASL